MAVVQGGGSGEDRFTGISTLSDGSVLLTGSYEAMARFGNKTLTSAGKSDIFLSRVNSDGGFIWTTGAGGAGEEAAHGLASYGDGSSLVAGYFHVQRPRDNACLLRNIQNLYTIFVIT